MNGFTEFLIGEAIVVLALATVCMTIYILKELR
jgi:hypothetical protein